MPVPTAVQSLLDQAVRDGVFPGAVLAVRCGGGPVDMASAGRLSTDPSSSLVQPTTIYDLASLTKPLATVTGIVLLLQDGRFRLTDCVDRFLPSLAASPIGSATLWDLLTHSSGLPGWRGYYERLCPAALLPNSDAARGANQERVLELLFHEELIYTRGARSLYSDLGFMLLGFIIERISGMVLHRFFGERIAGLSGAPWLRYIPVEVRASVLQDVEAGGCRIAPTEEDVWRGRLLCGEVHDENAAAMGGVAGHAGLFGTAESVLALSGLWLRALQGASSPLDEVIAREFVTRTHRIPHSSWALGWDTPSAPSSAGQLVSPCAFGHLGYTGTSLWVDPEREIEVVLVSNRVHPTRKNERIRAFRPVIHDAVFQAYG